MNEWMNMSFQSCSAWIFRLYKSTHYDRREGGNKRCLCPSVRLPVAYIANDSRTQRPSVPKFGMKVPHLRCDSHTSFKVKRSKVDVTDGLVAIIRINAGIDRATWRLVHCAWWVGCYIWYSEETIYIYSSFTGRCTKCNKPTTKAHCTNFI